MWSRYVLARGTAQKLLREDREKWNVKDVFSCGFLADLSLKLCASVSLKQKLIFLD